MGSSAYTYSVPWREKLLFLKLFAKWKGSVWQLLWIDITIYFLLHMSLTLSYRYILTEENGLAHQRKHFEEFVRYVKHMADVVPLSFLLGFFVTLIVGRWWNVCMTIPWMNHFSMMVHSMLPTPKYKTVIEKNLDKVKDEKAIGNIHETPDEASKRLDNEMHQIRLLILRYMNLAIAICMRSASIQMQKRFALKKRKFINQVGRQVAKAKNTLIRDNIKKKVPTVRQKLKVFNKDADVQKTFGYLITEEEIDTFEKIASEYHDYNNVEGMKKNHLMTTDPNDTEYEPEYWIPLQWASRALLRANELGYIAKDRQYVRMNQAIDDLRGTLQTLWTYSTFTIPLVYVQVVIIAVYSFFLGELFSRQYIDPPATKDINKMISSAVDVTFDTFIPIFSLLKFLFYVGWFKIGYALLDPLGEESEDFPVSEIFTYNLDVSIRIGGAPGYMYPAFLNESTESSNPLLNKISDIVLPPSIKEIVAEEHRLEEEEATAAAEGDNNVDTKLTSRTSVRIEVDPTDVNKDSNV